MDTLNGTTSKVRQLVSLTLGPISIEAILIPELDLTTAPYEVPTEWKVYKRNWANQLIDQASMPKAMVLMATDCASYFPHDILDSNSKPTIHKQAKLVKSMITNKYLRFGSCQNTQHLCSECTTLLKWGTK